MPLKSAKRSICAPGSCVPRLFRLPQQVVDQHLRVDLLLDVERRRVNDEIAPVLLILAAPDELRVEVGVARVFQPCAGASCSSSSTDWCSAVGMFLRLSSSCVSVSTVLPDVDLLRHA